jgi:hypothetical protein
MVRGDAAAGEGSSVEASATERTISEEEFSAEGSRLLRDIIREILDTDVAVDNGDVPSFTGQSFEIPVSNIELPDINLREVTIFGDTFAGTRNGEIPLSFSDGNLVTNNLDVPAPLSPYVENLRFANEAAGEEAFSKNVAAVDLKTPEPEQSDGEGVKDLANEVPGEKIFLESVAVVELKTPEPEQSDGEEVDIPVPDLGDPDGEEPEKDIYRDDIADEKMRAIFAAIRGSVPGNRQKARHKVVKFVIDNPRLINQKHGKHGVTLLHVAASVGDGRLVKHLLKNGADLHRKTDTGFTALYGAFRNGHDWVARYLVKQGLSCVGELIGGAAPKLSNILRHGDYEKIVDVLKNAFADVWESIAIAADGIDAGIIGNLKSDDSEAEETGRTAETEEEAFDQEDEISQDAEEVIDEENEVDLEAEEAVDQEDEISQDAEEVIDGENEVDWEAEEVFDQEDEISQDAEKVRKKKKISFRKWQKLEEAIIWIGDTLPKLEKISAAILQGTDEEDEGTQREEEAADALAQ